MSATAETPPYFNYIWIQDHCNKAKSCRFEIADHQEIAKIDKLQFKPLRNLSLSEKRVF
jgi:hypothetical protein